MRTALAIKPEPEVMNERNRARALFGLPPNEPNPPRPYWESIAIYRRPTNGRALILLLLKEVAAERRRIARHSWRFSEAYRAQKMGAPYQMLLEVRKLREALGAEVLLP